jgi:hypothetical protein
VLVAGRRVVAGLFLLLHLRIKKGGISITEVRYL